MPDLRAQGVLAIQRVAFSVDVVVGPTAKVLLLHAQVFLQLAQGRFLVVHPVTELIDAGEGVLTDQGFAADDVSEHVLHLREFAAVAGQHVVPCMVLQHEVIGEFVSHGIWIYWPGLLTGPGHMRKRRGGVPIVMISVNSTDGNQECLIIRTPFYYGIASGYLTESIFW